MSPPSIAVFVDRAGNMPSGPRSVIIRTATPVPVARFFRAIGVEVKTGALPDGTRCYLGQTVGLILAVVPASQSDVVAGGTHLYFMVDDVPTTVRLVLAEGGRLAGPMLAGYKRAVVIDPEGRRVLLSERSAGGSSFDDLESDHDRSPSSEPKPPVQFTAPSIRQALDFERVSAAIIAVGSLVLAVAMCVLIYKFHSATEREFVLFQRKPAQSVYYGWTWTAVVGAGIIALGRASAVISGNALAQVGYALLALALDVVAMGFGLSTVLAGAGSPMALATALFIIAVAGIVGSSRLQEAAVNCRRPQLRFWTKGTTGTFCAMFVLPIVAAILSTMLPKNWSFASGVMQAVFLAGLVMQACLHVVCVRFFHAALTAPDSVSGRDLDRKAASKYGP